jgi:hypothetical protein
MEPKRRTRKKTKSEINTIPTTVILMEVFFMDHLMFMVLKSSEWHDGRVEVFGKEVG